ncbi:MAG: excinuclease ABC subunit A, partial [Dehalococcoidia bacterium SM23_28_2]
MALDAIIVRGAREHNLKNIDVAIPRDKLVVITGVSGSGKSSLAFDTIYAEGQRRYVESLSAYARQFLGQMEKPDVDYIEGLSPAISIDQRGASRNPRSTVGTQTEIYDYLRLLFARVGRPHCPQCGRPIECQTVQQIVDSILALPAGQRLMIMAPVVRDRKGEHLQVFEDARKAGFVRVRVDGRIYDLAEDVLLDKNRRHSIEIVVDRLITEGPEGERSDAATRLADSVETALKLGGGIVQVSIDPPEGADLQVGSEERLYSEHFACVHCGISVGEIAPRNFSFNSPHGACPACTGLGVKMEIDRELVIPNRELSLAEGAIQPWARASTVATWYFRLIHAVADKYGFSTDVPVKELKPEDLDRLLYGSNEMVTVKYVNQFGRTQYYDTTFEGVIPNLERRHRETESDYVRMEIERYMAANPCPVCKGARLKPESLAVTIGDGNIHVVTRMSVVEALTWVEELQGPKTIFSEREQTIAHQVLKEIRARLRFLADVGVDYLTLDRATATLSAGEAQRLRLATQIGSGLMGVLYVCDEPSIGLHAVDCSRLISTLQRLRDLGNTVLVVEHDEATIRAADHIIDLGPGAGEQGGSIVVAGGLEELVACPQSITGQYISGAKEIPLPRRRRDGNGQFVVIHGARENNLKNIDVRIPLGRFVCVTGVSGSGKSTLIDDILHKKTAQLLYGARDRPGECDGISGLEN